MCELFQRKKINLNGERIIVQIRQQRPLEYDDDWINATGSIIGIQSSACANIRRFKHQRALLK